MKIIVTGGSGLIGRNLIESLLKLNHKIYNVGRTEVANCENIFVDFSKDWDISLLPNDVDVIIHLAQSKHFRDFPNFAIETYNINTLSTLKLLDFAKNSKINKFIYASSAGIYGTGTEVGFNETEPIIYNDKLGFYLATKHNSETIIDNYFNLLNVTVLRFFFVYGKGQDKSMLIPRLIENVKAGNSIYLQGNEGIKINPTYVEDAVTSIIKSIELASSNKINVAGPDVLSLKDITDIISSRLNKKAVIVNQDAEANNIIGDIEKMKKLLITPNHRFIDSISNLID